MWAAILFFEAKRLKYESGGKSINKTVSQYEKDSFKKRAKHNKGPF